MDTRAAAIILSVAALATVAVLFARGSRGQLGPDAGVIKQLKSAGSDLSKPHPIDFYLYVPNREAADRVAAKVLASGFEVKRLDRAATGPGWLVLATKTMVPTESELIKTRRQFESWAKAEGGEYDGWEAPVLRGS